jgi:HlyD family secretion protein
MPAAANLRAPPDPQPATDGRVARPTEAPAPPPVAAKAPSRRRRIGLFVLAVAGLLLLAGAAWIYFSPDETDRTRIDFQGNIDVRQVNLSFKVGGRIDTLTVDEGDSVKAGQVVATLERVYFDDDLRLARAQRDAAAATLERLVNGSRPEEIAQARARVDELKATLVRARQDFSRSEQGHRTGAVTREEFDRTRSVVQETEAQQKSAEQALRLAELGPRREDIAQARAQLRAEEARVTQIERQIADSRLLAPNDGTILTRAREKGAIVQPGETVFALTLTSPVWVRTYVGERDLGLVQPGMPAGVTTDSAPDKVYRGRVGFISPTAEFTPKTVETRELRTDLVYRLRIVVDDPDGGLRQGMPVTVALDLPAPRPKTFWEKVRDKLSFRRTGG